MKKEINTYKKINRKVDKIYDNDLWDNECEFGDLLGKTILNIERNEDDWQDTIYFTTENGVYVMTHDQCCCESVDVEDINGDLNDLIGEPIRMADESTNEGEAEYSNTHTWTFYKLATAKGYVTIRWYGESNGWYSESVDMYFIPNKKEG